MWPNTSSVSTVIGHDSARSQSGGLGSEWTAMECSGGMTRSRHPLPLPDHVRGTPFSYAPPPARCEVTSRFACLMKLNRKFLVSQLWRWAINSRSPSEGTTEARGPMAWEGSWEGCPIDRSISGRGTNSLAGLCFMFELVWEIFILQ